MLEFKYKITVIVLVAISIIVLLTMKKNNPMAISNKPVEHFTEPKYQKFKETSVPLLKTKEEKEKTMGNLDQCKIQCDSDKDCVGFVRDKVADTVTTSCYLLKNVVNCHNEFKEPSEKYILSPGLSENSHTETKDFFDYDTYLKLDVSSVQKDSIQKCIRLDQTTGISPRRYPFSLLVLDDNNNLLLKSKEKQVPNKKEVEDDLFYSKYSVFSVVKGLSGKGVSFKMNKNNSDFYVIRRGEGENLVLELEDDSLVFKQNASFILDMEYSEDESLDFSEVKYLSIKHESKGIINYWKINEVTQKVVLVNKSKLGEDLEDIMFQFKHPLEYEEEKKKEEVDTDTSPAPTIEEVVETVVSNKDMSEELEKLELDIRESQHKQNVKLMNIMLDVNKFKLHDLSMSNYLTQCVRTSEEQPSYIDTKIQSGVAKTSDINNTNQNNQNNEVIDTPINNLEPAL